MIRNRLKATDLYLLNECDRLVYLDYYGDPARRVPLSSYQVWLVERGVLFERQVLNSIQPERPPLPAENIEEAFNLTCDLMQSGVEMIYQGVLVDGDLAGMPDLLVRTSGASRWGSYHYRPLDIKSTATPTLGHRLQVMAYVALLHGVQGAQPQGSLLLKVPAAEAGPDQLYREEIVPFDEALFAQHLSRVRALAAGHEPRPFIASVCRECGWQAVCRPIAEREQDISLIPGLKRAVWEELHAQGLGALPTLAAAHPEALTRIKGVGAKTAGALVQQARAQASGHPIQLRRPDLSRVDPVAFFDVETVPGENLTYLMGALIRRGGLATYEYDLAESFSEEGAMWRSFLARIQTWDGPVYHYSTYERTIIRRLVERHGDADRAEALLSRMIDLERTLKESTVLPLESYSLKEVAPWLGFHWGGEVTAAQDSMLEYIHFLADGDPAHLTRVLRYNEDDCRATALIHDWLLSLAESA